MYCMKTLKYILVLVVLGLLLFLGLNKDAKEIQKEPSEETEEKIQVLKPDVMNMTYIVDGDVFKLVDGRAEKTVEVELDGYTTTISLMLVGEPLYADIDGDGDTDSAVWLVNNSGGTGRFIYGAFVINNGENFKSPNAMFLGDRILTKNIEWKEGRVVYNFLERGFDEPMSADPTIPRTVWVHYDKARNEIGEWVKDFEGESR